MGNKIRMYLAVVVMVAALAFSVYGVARAASGFVSSGFSGLSQNALLADQASSTPEPTDTIEPTDTAEPTDIAETQAPEDVHIVGTPQAEPTELNDNSQGNESGSVMSTPKPEDGSGFVGSPQSNSRSHEDSGSGSSSGSGSNSGDDSGGD